MKLFGRHPGDFIKIKICGLTCGEDIDMCSDLHVNAIGFLVKDARGEFPTDKLTPRQARELIARTPDSLSTVLLVRNRDQLREISDLIELTRPSAIQLQEETVTPEVVRLLKQLYKEIEIIKTVHVMPLDNGESLRKRMEPFLHHVDAILLDSCRGGSGEVHDWQLSAEIAADLKRKGIPMVLAGGLNEDNLEKAIAMVEPSMVDIMTGATEKDRKDRKNREKIRKLVEIVNNKNK